MLGHIFDNKDTLSEYELIRLSNIKRNSDFLTSIGFKDLSSKSNDGSDNEVVQKFKNDKSKEDNNVVYRPI